MTPRRLTPADAALWHGLWAEAQAQAAHAFAPARDADTMAARRASARVFVLEGTTGPLAGALWCRDEDPAQPARGWVEAMYVTPAARGQGIAGRLLATLAADAAAQGMAELWLEVGRDNAPARRAYARAGFHPAPAPALRCDEIALMRRLEPAPPPG